eukprot:jgi/Chlat1/6675/Chrsp49S09077
MPSASCLATTGGAVSKSGASASGSGASLVRLAGRQSARPGQQQHQAAAAAAVVASAVSSPLRPQSARKGSMGPSSTSSRSNGGHAAGGGSSSASAHAGGELTRRQLLVTAASSVTAAATSDEEVGITITKTTVGVSSPPVAKKVKTVLTSACGDKRVDNYYWMRDDARQDPEVLDYIVAENTHTERVLSDTAELQEELYKEMRSRIKEAEQSVALRDGPFYYYDRMEEGKQYRVHCRRRIPEGAPALRLGEALYDVTTEPEEILLDENERAAAHEYYVCGDAAVSPDHQVLAIMEDTAGGEKYTLRVKDLATGEFLSTRVENCAGDVMWANDNRSLFYLTLDDIDRPHKLWRHTVGTSSTEDVCVYHEDDEQYHVSIGKSESEKYLFVSSNSTITSEAWFISADRPQDAWQVILPRVHGTDYSVSHTADHFFITLRTDDSVNSVLCVAPVAEPSNLRTILPHRTHVKLEDVQTFAQHVAVSEREGGLQHISVYRLDDLLNNDSPLEKGTRISFPEEAYSLSSEESCFKSSLLRFEFNSLKTPATVVEYDMNTHERAVLKTQAVLGDFDASLYKTVRRWATAEDGVRVPISIVFREDVVRLDGSDPLLLDGYGSYEACSDPYFSSTRVSLLDRGFIFAIAHIRGGGEMGRAWYEDGKLLHKKNTFTDFIACAEYLINNRWTSPSSLCMQGRSAGGLLMGAVLNMRPDLFAAAIAAVPFVDVLTTVSDPSIPLTTIEWEEWGNPAEKVYYDYIKSYSPLDNVQRQAYPHLLITAGLHDPRVGYWEPLKFAAKLREHKQDDNLCLVKCDMGAGHFSKSGRFDRLREVAFEQAFLLKALHLSLPHERLFDSIFGTRAAVYALGRWLITGGWASNSWKRRLTCAVLVSIL